TLGNSGFSLRCRVSPRPSSCPHRAWHCALALFLLAGTGVTARAQDGTSAPAPPQAQAQQSRETRGVQQRIPRQQALLTAALDGMVRAPAANGGEARPVAGARIALRNLQGCQRVPPEAANGEGVFRVVSIPPGHYELRVEAEGFAPFVIADLALNSNEVTTLEIALV